MASGPGFALRMNLKQAKRFFLDRDAGVEAMDRKNRRVLARVGGLTRQISRRSIRKARKATIAEFDPELKKLLRQGRDAKGRFTLGADSIAPFPLAPSKPGKPPKSRTGILRDLIFFAVDPSFQSVIIGPLVGKSRGAVPETLEEGGTVTAGTWVRIYEKGKRKIRLSLKHKRNVRLKARPYMAPAYDEALDRLIPGIYRD